MMPKNFIKNLNIKDSILDFKAMRLGASTEFRWHRTIWSEEAASGYPDQEVRHVFLPFIPFVYVYVWLNFYRNGCFSKVPVLDYNPEIHCDKYFFYRLFIH